MLVVAGPSSPPRDLLSRDLRLNAEISRLSGNQALSSQQAGQEQVQGDSGPKQHSH
jgi:hypothetical protein